MISNYLKEYFKENNISNYEIERRTGINQSKVNLSLNGKRKLTAEELIKIAIAFNLDLNKIKEIIQSPNLKWFLIWQFTKGNYPSKIVTLRFNTEFIADVIPLPAISLYV